MKITDVKATSLQGYKQWNYVRIETDEGLAGFRVESTDRTF